MSSKETLTSFMDMLGFKEISYAFEFIAENNFSESQITALVREFTKPAIELIECKKCDYNYSKDCNEGCRKLISEEEF